MFSKGSFFIHKTAARTFTAQTAVSPLLSLFVLIKKALQSALLGNILAHSLSEGPQGLLLLPVEGGGDLDPDSDVLVAPAPASQLRDTLPPQAEGGPGLGPGRQIVFHLAVDGGDLQLGPHHRLVEGHRLLIEHRGAVPVELGMGLDMDRHDQVAGGTAVLPGIALAPQGDGLAVVDAGGDADRDPLGLFHAAAAAAGLAGGVDDLARPPAAGAGGSAGEGEAAGALLHPDHAGAPAVGTGLRRGARLRRSRGRPRTPRCGSG